MNIINGILAASLAFTGGTGLALFSDKDTPNQNTVIQEQSGNYDQMVELMESGDVGSMQKYMEEGNMNVDEMQKFMEEGNMNFGQMKPYMSEMHPNLNNQQLEEMYKGMHGTGGSSQSSNFREMGNL
ncbi:hypothetical protein ABW02_23015 [Niallia circulans]|nr:MULTISPECIES: hypothetical protein [Bacillaceae]EOR22153.1 hypothetical protein A499_19673 [Niallia nealsonii AAU1]SLL35223.1 Uncharacterised protein [Mycobacteroides abscessus subsp. abscessus]HEO8422545.1 hypothetical protein [Yersinia enterocolitica]KLV21552.1 hypothetical protein ABW02_23015 [Niallia circulans]MCB5237302.1 hypothetical protein [Niallia circulans]